MCGSLLRADQTEHFKTYNCNHDCLYISLTFQGKTNIFNNKTYVLVASYRKSPLASP